MVESSVRTTSLFKSKLEEIREKSDTPNKAGKKSMSKKDSLSKLNGTPNGKEGMKQTRLDMFMFSSKKKDAAMERGEETLANETISCSISSTRAEIGEMTRVEDTTYFEANQLDSSSGVSKQNGSEPAKAVGEPMAAIEENDSVPVGVDQQNGTPAKADGASAKTDGTPDKGNLVVGN